MNLKTELSKEEVISLPETISTIPLPCLLAELGMPQVHMVVYIDTP